ncbi:flavin reductase family protein [Thermanaeromonas sp. C210]|uniref:flavin reductase family protein n=1 Tax=Thermanaeromonas sp. C210 TaxID=2731925 RepID=UPI00155BFFBF|nr:flavin reductase family protein [Thermanaeromonas sp. C210]GFN24298.1 flavin reductase [Thermanaeromonas sp. C210]
MAKVNLPKTRLPESYYFLQPSNPVLVTTLEPDGTTHVAPFSWVTPVSVNPPRVGLALLNSPKKQHTLKNIEREGEFVINLPNLDIAERLVKCSYMVEPGQKKFTLAGFTAIPSREVKPCGVAECRAHMECRVLSITETGDHSFIVADVVHCQVSVKYYPRCWVAVVSIKEPLPNHLRGRG